MAGITGIKLYDDLAKKESDPATSRIILMLVAD
jgi:hypothetical protein